MKSGSGRIEEGGFRFFRIIRKIILEWNEKEKSWELNPNFC